MANNVLLASDNFASGSLAAGWSAVPGQSVCQVVVGPPNFTEANVVGTTAGQIWTGLTWPNDQASEVTVTMTGSAVATTLIQLHVRNQGGGSYNGYRAIVKDSGAWEIDIVTAGTPTVLASGTGLTIGAKDIWCFAAAGSCLSLYQNYAQIGFIYNATYMSGSIGYSQQATTSLSTNEVFSWRGYSAVQKDGIWQKQGIVIPANATDLTGSGEIGTQNPTIIGPEAGEILSGQVLKMWFAVPGAIGYAESPATDGQNWTRGSNVITHAGMGITPAVIKVGSTYHMYDGNGVIQHWTSASASTGWTQQSSNVFTKTSVVYFSPVAIISGTWNALYTIQTGTFPNQTGLATSSDGVTWADQGIKVNNFWGVTRVNLINGVYHAWGQTVNPNGHSAKPGIDPGEGLRMQTTDFKTWTNAVHSMHHSQMFEGVNEVNGGCFVSFPVDIGSKAILFYSAGPDDAIQTSNSPLQIGVAIGPATIASILTAKEDGLLQLASDNFISGVGNLSSSWITPTGGTKLQIVSGNLVESTIAGVWNGMVYAGVGTPIFSPDQYSKVTVAALSSLVPFLTPTVRASSTALTFYEGYGLGGIAGTTTKSVGIGKWVAGVETLISPLVQITLQVGDVWCLQVVSNVISLFQNDYLIVQVQDSSITTGNPGMNTYVPSGSLTQSQISLWAGGNANVIPNYPGGGSLLLCGVGK